MIHNVFAQRPATMMVGKRWHAERLIFFKLTGFTAFLGFCFNIFSFHPPSLCNRSYGVTRMKLSAYNPDYVGRKSILISINQVVLKQKVAIFSQTMKLVSPPAQRAGLSFQPFIPAGKRDRHPRLKEKIQKIM